MATWNQSQAGFTKRVAIVVGSALTGWGLITIGDSLIMDTGMASDPDAYFWLNKGGGLLALISTVMAIVTLVYGRTHEAAIRESKVFSFMLTGYRILFWLSVAASVLALLFLVWVIMHLGPVR